MNLNDRNSRDAARCDTVVVGAGSVGCVVATRLAHEFGQHVVMCEAPSPTGAADTPTMDLERPSRWLRLLSSDEATLFATEPASGLANRSIAWPRGRGLGGSSRINAMIWHEPTPRDLEVLVSASGQKIDLATLNEAIAHIEARIEPETPQWLSQSSSIFLEAARSLAGDHAPQVYRRFNRRGRRTTAAELLHRSTSSVHPSTPHRGSLTIVRGTVDRVLWQVDRATGVRILTSEGAQEIPASHGVVLCAGTLATPSILARSGIGPAETLHELGVDRRSVCDAVGGNLQDHLVMPVIFEIAARDRYSDDVSMRDLWRWQNLGTGPVVSNIAECGGQFAQGRWQIHTTPTHYLTFPHPKAPAAMTVAINTTRPKSRGRMRVNSRDPFAAPLIDTGYLDDPADRDDLVNAVRFVREIAAREPLASFIREELVPSTRREDDTAILRAIARYAQTLYHPVGTCAMRDGNSVSESGVAPGVVDGDFRVLGQERLWVADGSILSEITQGNPSVLLMAIGWVAAERIAEDCKPAKRIAS